MSIDWISLACQQVSNPPFISLYAFGGFDAQNSDGEWSDARQARFAETYLHYYNIIGNREYLERAIAACRASFALMTLPENAAVCPNNYQGSKYTGLWSGTMAENYGHHGRDAVSGQSGFHWGTGSALTTAAIFQQQLGDLYVSADQQLAIGVNGVVVDRVQWKRVPVITTKRIVGMEGRKLRVVGEGRRFKSIIVDGKQITVE